MNDRYSAFVMLSREMSGVESSLSDTKTKIIKAQEGLEGVTREVRGELEVVTALLKEREELARAQGTLALLLACERTVRKLEVLMKEEELERIAGEFFQLHFFVHSVPKDLPFVKSLQPRVQKIEASLSGVLSSRFEAALLSGNPEQLSTCLRAYAAIDRHREAESLYGRVVVRPLCAKVLGAAARPSSSSSSSLLSPPYQALLESLASTCGTFLALDILGDYRVVARGVWPEVKAALEKKFPDICSPAEAARFHAAYGEAMAFVAGLRGLCRGPEEVAVLDALPEMEEYLGRWEINLPIYFGLVQQRVTAAAEAALGSTSPVVDQLRGAEAVLIPCWGPDVYIPSLAHRFARLAMLLLERLGRHLQAAAPRLAEAGPTARLHGELSALEARCAAGQGAWAINSASDEVRQALASRAAELLSPLRADLDRSIVQSLQARPAEALLALKSLTATYRLMNKEVPTKPSVYVPNLYRPIRAFLDEHPGEQAEKWAWLALEGIAERYRLATEELLANMRQTEESLRRLHSAKQQGGAVDKSLNSDKIYLQLNLDLDDFAKGVALCLPARSAEELAAFRPLRQLCIAKV